MKIQQRNIQYMVMFLELMLRRKNHWYKFSFKKVKDQRVEKGTLKGILENKIERKY